MANVRRIISRLIALVPLAPLIALGSAWLCQSACGWNSDVSPPVIPAVIKKTGADESGQLARLNSLVSKPDSAETSRLRREKQKNSIRERSQSKRRNRRSPLRIDALNRENGRSFTEGTGEIREQGQASLNAGAAHNADSDFEQGTDIGSLRRARREIPAADDSEPSPSLILLRSLEWELIDGDGYY